MRSWLQATPAGHCGMNSCSNRGLPLLGRLMHVISPFRES